MLEKNTKFFVLIKRTEKDVRFAIEKQFRPHRLCKNWLMKIDKKCTKGDFT